MRVYPDDENILTLDPGDYGQDIDGKWWVCCPSGNILPLVLHVVTENSDDGSISVSPSIVDPAARYIGYLINGEWHKTP